ncbi:MAG: hypothetical protein ACAI34_16220 [Verrucomicrobium sp.]
MKILSCLTLISTLLLCQCEKAKEPPAGQSPTEPHIMPEPGGAKPATPTEPSGEPKPGEQLTPGSGFPTGGGQNSNSSS